MSFPLPIGVMTAKSLLLPMLVVVASLSGCLDEDSWATHDRDHDQDDHHRHRHVHAHAEHRTDEGRHEHTAGAFCSTEGITDAHIQAAHQDAEERYANLLDGDERASRTFTVGPKTGSLRVAALYDLHGSARITLYDPLWREVAKTHFEGHKEADEPSWYETDAPLVGTWTVKMSLEETHGGYSVGVYLK